MQIKKVTSKRKGRIVLPGQTTVIYQSNRITNGKFKGFTLLQSKILLCLIKNIQKEIKANMAGRDWTQGELFDETRGMLRVGLPLSEIASHQQYKEIYSAAKELQGISVELKSKEKGYIEIASLMPRLKIPKITGGKSVMYVEMFKDVAEKIIEVDKNKDGHPQFFTKYLYEVAMASRNKYTWKLYAIISSWKEKGGFKINLRDLREQLGLDESEYPRYSEFKRRVLMAVQEELKEMKADCWFNCKEKTFELKENRQVTTLCFKIIVPEMIGEAIDNMENIKNLLRLHLKFKDSHIKALDTYLGNEITKDRTETLYLKITEINGYINDVKGTEEKARDVAAYTLKSIINSNI